MVLRSRTLLNFRRSRRDEAVGAKQIRSRDMGHGSCQQSRHGFEFRMTQVAEYCATECSGQLDAKAPRLLTPWLGFVSRKQTRNNSVAFLKSKTLVVFSYMSSSTLFKVAALTLISAIVGATAIFGEPPNKQFRDKYVFVTGSRIPQKVKVKSIGTATVSPLNVIKRREIDHSGRFTTEGVVALDPPSVRVVSGRGGSGF
jgi:hypothetical protein